MVLQDRIEDRTDVVTGMWKFKNTVLKATLMTLVGEWLVEAGNPYLDLYICKCSKDQNGIGFQRVLEDESYVRFFQRMTDMLKRRFGNELAGWDISCVTTVTHIFSPSAKRLASTWWWLLKDTSDGPQIAVTAHCMHTQTDNRVIRYREAVAFAYEALHLADTELPPLQEDAVGLPPPKPEYGACIKAALIEYYGKDVAEAAFARASKMNAFS